MHPPIFTYVNYNLTSVTPSANMKRQPHIRYFIINLYSYIRAQIYPQFLRHGKVKKGENCNKIM